MNAGRLVMRATATRARKARVEARRRLATARAAAAVRAGFLVVVVADVADVDDAEALMMPQSPMMTSAAVSPPREPTLSIALTTE